MARNLALKTNVEPADSDYPYGRIKDDSGSGDGTPVNELVYGDIHQFFARMFAKSGLIYNNLPDSDYSDFQFFEAAQKLWKKFGGVNYITSTGTTFLTRNKYDLCHVINSSANNIVWLYDDSVLEDGDTVYIYNQSNYNVRINPSSANIFGDTFIYLYSSGDFVNLVYDKANTRWVYANKRIRSKFENITPTGDYTVPATVFGESNVFQSRLNRHTNEVEFRGSILYSGGGGAPGAILHTLPLDEIPSAVKLFIVPISVGGSALLTISHVTGDMYCQPGGGGEIISLDSVRFSLD